MTRTNPDPSTEADEPTDERGFARRTLLGAFVTLTGLPAISCVTSAQSTVESIVDAMTLEEKIRMVHGHEGPWTGYIPAVDRHGVPEIAMLDGPVGVRTETGDPMTAFPASIAMTSTFDPDLMYAQGEAMGRETKAADAHCLLGPGLNVHRVPTCGRNFEYYSEDPYLTAQMAAACCAGVQSEGVVATPKHYVANHQETERRNLVANIEERALREIYLPGFKAAVQEGGAGAVMSAYNGVNGDNCSENAFLLTEVLKEEWGFEGYVVSDWDAIEESVPSANAGLDLDMPGAINWGGSYFDADLQPAVESGQVPEARLDDMVARILRSYAATGHLDGDIGSGEANTPEHQALAREIAEQGAVLLKNEGDVLPLDVDQLDSIGVVGPTADQPIVGGGGAAEVQPPYAISALEGIQDYVGGRAEIVHEPWSVSQAASADVVLAFGHVDSSEFEDRQDMHLDGNQDDVIQQAADANPNTVAVVRVPGPIEMPWLDDVAGVLCMWYPGMEDGVATANVLFGEANPAGKLPTTFGASEADYPATVENSTEIDYDEGVFVGYRHFDEAGIEPLFPFGYGLSYTTFEYSNLQVPASVDPDVGGEVSVDVTNTGDREGAEIVQVYVEELDPAVPRPPKELKGFDKVWLQPDETGTATIRLDREAFQYWSPTAQTWTVDDGEFRIHVGASSRDVRSRASVQVVTGGETVPPIDGVQPQDLDSDGRYEDVNGNGTADFDDVVTFFEHMDEPEVQNYVAAYDFNGNDRIDFDDVVALFETV